MVALAALSLLAGPTFLDARLRAEARSGTAADGTFQAAPETVLSPELGMRTADGGLSLELGYLPRLSFLADAGGNPQLLQRGTGQVAFSEGRVFRAALRADVTSGENDFSPLAGVAEPVDPRLPARRTVRYLRSDTSVALEREFDSRLKTAVVASFLREGGLGADRGLIPTRQGPQVLGTASWLWTHVDTLDARLLGSVTEVSGNRTGLVESAGALRHSFDRHWAAGLEAGVAGATSTLGGNNFFPVAGASLEVQPPVKETPLTLSLRARTYASVDRFTGSGYQRGEIAAALGVKPAQLLSLSARATGSRTLSGAAAGDSVAGLETIATLTTGRFATFSLGARSAWLQQRALAGSRPVQWSGFAAVSLAGGETF